MFLLLFCFSFHPPRRMLGREEEAGVRITLRRGRVHCQGQAPRPVPALQSRLNAQGQAGGSRPAAHRPPPHLEEGSPPRPPQVLAGWNSGASGGPHCKRRPPLLCPLNNHQKTPPLPNKTHSDRGGSRRKGERMLPCGPLRGGEEARPRPVSSGSPPPGGSRRG